MIQTMKFVQFVQHYVKHALPIAQIAFHARQFNLELFMVLHAYAKQDITKLRVMIVNLVIFHV